MAGHSQFKNIMYRKGAQDAKRAKAFTKLIRELTVAARTGLADPEFNARLRSAITAAKAANMPKDTMERAIKRGTGEDGGAQYEEVRYEGYGPGGVALIVEALTDNRNRTASELRAAFSKHGGAFGEIVNFQFERVGLVRFSADVASAEEMFEAALEAGAEDVVSNDHGHEVTCAPNEVSAVRDALEQRFGPAAAAVLDWKPLATVPVDEETATSLFKLLDVLDDNDDVQRVASNFDVADEVMERLSA
jgi:YebC/PmpR family DNA-binding regulatory protein